MKLAWFRTTPPDTTDPLDEGAALIAELRSTHEVEVFTAAPAHDFVWRHARAPYTLCIHDLDNTIAHQFIWPYLLHYGGVLRLRSVTLHDSRAHALAREQRRDDYRAEVAFNNGRSMLRAPLLASKVVAVPHTATAAALQEEFPDARVRVAPTGVTAVPTSQQVRRESMVTIGVLEGRLDLIERAIARARRAGAPVDLIGGRGDARVASTNPMCTVAQDADVILALNWPTFGEPQTAALVGMAAGKPVVVLDIETTADWPSLDPQTWRPRGPATIAPIAVSIDPRDEEHSLMLAIRRLAADAALRAQLGAAAVDWWATHATVRHAAEAWRRILDEAASVEPPARPPNWPPHLTADGTERAREMLGEMGATVDVL